jgi:hypothetical protein
MRLLAILVPFVCVPLLLPAAPASRAAPVPRAADKPVYYFPTRVGTKWVYDEKGGHEECYGKIVTASEEKDGRLIVTVKTTSADFAEDLSIAQYAVSKDGLFAIAYNLNAEEPLVKHDEPYLLLKLPHKDGNTWENETDKLFRRKPVAKKVETVKVPAGTFEAIRVEAGEIVNWYAPGVGLVKHEWGRVSVTMKSFELPK